MLVHQRVNLYFFIGETNGWGAPVLRNMFLFPVLQHSDKLVKAQCLCLEVETPPFLLVQPLHKSQP